MIDFTFVLGHVQGKAIVPDVNFESDYYHWDATPDLSYVAYRYEIQWQDVEYADVECFAHTAGSHLVNVTFYNNTNLPKEYVATVFAVRRAYRHATLALKPGETWIGGEAYTHLAYPTASGGPDAPGGSGAPDIPYLKAGERALRRGVCRSDLLVDKHGLGNIVVPYNRRHRTFYQGNTTFLMQAGTTLRYTLDAAASYRTLYLRYAMSGVRRLSLTVRAGDSATTLDLTESAAEAEITYADLRLVKIVLPQAQPIDVVDIHVDAVEVGMDAPSFVLDGLLLTNETAPPEARFTLYDAPPCFEIDRRPGRTGVVYTTSAYLDDGPTPIPCALYSEDERPVPPPPYSDATLPQVYHSELSSTPILRRLNNDSLTNWHRENVILRGDEQNHFAGYTMAPVVVPPHSQRAVTVALACGEGDDLWAQAKAAYDQRTAIEARTRARLQGRPDSLPDSPYRFSQERMRTQLYTNVIYPESLNEGFCRTYVPGKRFPAFILWDSGMHGIGLNEYASERALEIVNQAMAFEEEDVMVVLKGAPLPLHIYLLNEIYQTTGDRAMLEAYYPRARAYQRFFSGQTSKSSFDYFGTGLLTPFFENGNSMGIDDYAAQHYVHEHGLSHDVSPVCTTAHAIRVSKLTQRFAHELGLDDEVADLGAWIDHLTHALQTYAWHEASGYYAYVINETKVPLLYDDGSNFNMGLDGVSPLVADVGTIAQRQQLIEHLMTPGELWAPAGITAVAMDAPYYRPDGYWVGKVWIPHQWFMWKALIGLGELAHAERIARTALRVWQAATDATYNVWETFDAQTGMGEGAHQFAGLSGPIAQFYHRYHTPGHVTVGFDTVIHDVTTEGATMTLTLSSPFRTGPTGIIAVMAAPGRYQIAGDGASRALIAPERWLNLTLNLSPAPKTITLTRLWGGCYG
jgi:hypothetical protein